MVERSFIDLQKVAPTVIGFDIEYAWENVILRLWIFRSVAKTLIDLPEFSEIAKKNLAAFDEVFIADGYNALKVFRDYIEHFNEYTTGKGRGPAINEFEADPWRNVTVERFEFGPYVIELAPCKSAADELRRNSFRIIAEFKTWYIGQHNIPAEGV